MNAKTYFCMVILLFSVNTAVISQNKDFVMGAFMGFYGIENRGDIKDMYSNINGNISGTGGLSFGINVKHDFSKNIFGALELRYIRKGSIKTILTSTGSRSWESIRLDYIEAPLLAGIKINTKKKPYFIETGFAYARLFKARVLVSELNEWNTSFEEKNFRKNDISWVASLKHPVNKSQKLVIGLRFSHSLFSIQSLCKLYNMDYGIEFYYLFNENLK